VLEVLICEPFDVVKVSPHEMVGGLEHLEEVEAEPCEHSSFVGYLLVENDVVRGDPVRGHEQQMLGIDLVDLPYLAGRNVWKFQHVARE